LLNRIRHIRACLQIAILALALPLILAPDGTARAEQQSEPPRTFEGLLNSMASGPANPCTGRGEDYSHLEHALFRQADDAVIQALNQTSDASFSGPSTLTEKGSSGSPSDQKDSPRARALDAVYKLEHLSAEINRNWPEENRFHTEVFEFSPAVVVKMTYRNRATFSFFAIPELDPLGKPTKLWQRIGALDDGRSEPRAGYDSVELFPLERGPSRRARFLAKFGAAGCGSGVGVAYYVHEWNPHGAGDLKELIKVEGAVSQEDPIGKTGAPKRNLSSSFPPIGELQTNGPLITLPYCWFSAIAIPVTIQAFAPWIPMTFLVIAFDSKVV